ncbi:hypothetical protein ACFYXD_00520 [Streptomyces platensis]|uniref:hypothetical protein n=1 Tax=Streptomyces platensis TaxID=58346 RepID=UPI003674813F
MSPYVGGPAHAGLRGPASARSAGGARPPRPAATRTLRPSSPHSGRGGRTRPPASCWPNLVTDAFTEGSRQLADAHAARSAAGTYAYLFRWRPTAFGGSLGACHCVELPFVFDRTGVPGLRGPQALLGDGELPSDLASHMHRAWAGFAATGDPGWVPYRPGEDRTVEVIDERWRPADG